MKTKTPSRSKAPLSLPIRMNQWLISVQLWLHYGSAAIIAFMMVATTIDIVLRYLGHAIEGVFEGVEILMVMAVYLGLAHVQHHEKNVRVEMIVERFTGKTRCAIEVFNLLLPTLVFTVMIWMTGTRAWHSFLIHESTFMPAEHPIWLGRIVLTVGLFFLWLRLVIQIGQYLPGLFGKDEDSTKTMSSGIVG
jgi:TRAP-type C4-dicarboxylate transport system permease small subunit